jgi:hypothetical protein
MLERKNMDILKQVKEILAQQNAQEKDTLLSQLDDVLEYHHEINEADVVEGMRLLLVTALQEGDQRMRQKLFRTLDTAVACQDIGDRMDWDRLAIVLPSLGKWELQYVLDVLGLSGQVRYLPVLEEYTHDTDPEIREWAQEAITEIGYRVAHASDSQKEGKLTA